MAIRIVDERNVLDEALALARRAERTLDIASPWIRASSIRRLLRARGEGVAVRVLFRVKEPEDLEITDLGALLALARKGVAIRYSTRLHAKVIVADGSRAVVSSSNVTEAAGFGSYEPERRNRELGLVVEGDPGALADIAARFEDAWAEGEWLDDEVVGVVMDFPTDHTFHVACLKTPSPGTYVVARGDEESTVIGRVSGVTGYNRTFPRMTAGMWATQGYGAAPDAGGRSYEFEDLQSLFSAPDKERGVLGVVTAVREPALFHVAAVEVLASLGNGDVGPPRLPAGPGFLARRAGPSELDGLLGGGTLTLGTLWHHPDVIVRGRSEELLARHVAIRGMTGSGKSNAMLVIIWALLDSDPGLRVLLVDSHGEYRTVPSARIVRPSVRIDLLAEGAAKALLGLAREDATLAAKLHEAATGSTDVDGFASGLESLAQGEESAWASRALSLAALCRKAPDRYCLGGPAVSFDAPWGDGLNVLDLSGVEGLETRARIVGKALDEVYSQGARREGSWLVALDEAQNYVPEQQTGLLARTRPSFDAAFRIASEGRKFGVGLMLASQRPARVNKDVLSQYNSHLVFRLANVEDLQAVAGCFETAGRRQLEDLPGLPVGVCLAGGTAFGMPVRGAGAEV
ncbi:MAG: helicase HerA domain-containing protein [Actinomycetota bacterium]